MSQAREQRLFHLMQVAAHRLKTELDRQTQAAGGLTAAQAAVLAVVARTGGATQKSVADQLRQQESAITAMASRLTKAGFLERRPHPEDGRAWLLALTAEGEAAMARFRGPMEAYNARITEALGGDEEVARLAAALRTLADLDFS